MTQSEYIATRFPKQPVIELAALGCQPAELPSLLDLPHRLLTHSGRSAMLIALNLLGIRKGDRVLVPTYHCPTMISPVAFIGATPVFYPITDLGIPNLSYLEKANLGGTRAILVPHLFGLPRPLNEIAEYCRSHGISLIEDCAHCFFGQEGRTAIGTTGDFAIGSLPKFFPVIEGGLLASATRRIPEGLLPSRPLRHEFRGAWDMVDVSARAGRLGLMGILARRVAFFRQRRRQSQSIANPVHDDAESLRSESLGDELLAPIAIRRIESLVVSKCDFSRAAAIRRWNYRAISAAMARSNAAFRPFPDCDDNSAPYVFPLLVHDREGPYTRMRAAGLPVFRWDRVWPNTPALPDDTAANWFRGLIQIACHQSLRPAEIGKICRSICECLDHPR